MLEDPRDKQLQRNQLLALLLMTLLVVVWSYFFLPSPVQAPQQPLEDAPVPTEQSRPAPPAAPARTIEGLTLPPVAEAADPAEEEIVIENEYLRLVFTRVGARLKQAHVILGEEGRDSIQLVPSWGDLPDAEAVYPLGLQFASDYLGEELNRRRWEPLVDPDGKAVTFSINLGTDQVIKTFRLSEDPRVLDAQVTYRNQGESARVLGLDTKEPAFSLVWAPNVESEDMYRGVAQEVLWRREGLNTHHTTSKLSPPAAGQLFTDRASNPDFVAVKSAYFAVALKPEFSPAEAWVLGTSNPAIFNVGLAVPRVELAPGQDLVRDFRLYLGPTQLSALRQAWPELDSLLQFFTMFNIMDVFAKFLLSIVHWFYSNAYANYGFAIIFLTVLVRTALFPLTLKSMRSMKKMQKLAPEMEKMKAEVGDDQQELQRRMMELYRERGVNPLGGCLPIMLQMPVFIALWRVLSSAFELRRAPFVLWINDLSEPDALFQLPFALPIPFVQNPVSTFNLLPILMGIAMVASTKLMPTSGPVQTQQQKIIMNVVPIIFSVMCYNMASGLTLYILTSTVLGIAQNYFVHVSDSEVQKKVKKPKPSARSRNPYTAALARKRQVAREEKRERRAKANKPETKPKNPSRKP